MELNQMIEASLAEDLPRGDVTTDSLGLSEKIGHCRLVAKQTLILSGTDLFTKTVKKIEPQCQLSWEFKDGDQVNQGTTVCQLHGNLIEILKAERVALNFLGHLSGVATLTHQFVESAPHIKILDTRKTLPLYRTLEKQAVLDGGGKNHRLNLSDTILIKENHICAAGSLKQAILKIKQNKPNLPIEVEVKNINEVKQAIELGADRLLLDNMTNEQLKDCLKIIPSQIKIEASGNMTIDRVKSLSDFNLDFISVGALTHSAPVADFSLLFQWDSTSI